jgi:hypothetical protein
MFVDDWEASLARKALEDGLIPVAKEVWLAGGRVESQFENVDVKEQLQ